MNTRLLMRASAVFSGAFGAVATFFTSGNSCPRRHTASGIERDPCPDCRSAISRLCDAQLDGSGQHYRRYLQPARRDGKPCSLHDRWVGPREVHPRGPTCSGSYRWGCWLRCLCRFICLRRILALARDSRWDLAVRQTGASAHAFARSPARRRAGNLQRQAYRLVGTAIDASSAFGHDPTLELAFSYPPA